MLLDWGYRHCDQSYYTIYKYIPKMHLQRNLSLINCTWKVHERHHTETTHLAVLTMQLTRYLLTTVYNSWWQLTSRSRLESLHIVSQGMVPLPSGHISSSPSTTVLDICMVGWTGEHEQTVHVVYCVLALTQTLTQHIQTSQTNDKIFWMLWQKSL